MAVVGVHHNSINTEKDNNSNNDNKNLLEETKRLKQEVESLRKRLNRQEQEKVSRSRQRNPTRRSPPPPLPSLGEHQQSSEQSVAEGLHHRYYELQTMRKSYTSKDSNMIVPDDTDIESPRSPPGEEISLLHPDDESSYSGDESETESLDVPFTAMVLDRAGWLVGLLVLQSMSSFIIQRNEGLLQKHLVIIRFLTMLVGAGGNAGNQASVRVIRGLAVGAIKRNAVRSFLWNEFAVGLCLSLILGVAGWLRAAVFATPLFETVAITASLFMIVMISVVLGATLPLGMKMVGIDPAHSSTTIQVLMDILGVTITVCVSALILDSRLGAWLGVEPSESGSAN